jgi:hypothetical protein
MIRSSTWKIKKQKSGVFQSAIFVIHGANSGYLRESVVLGAIMDTTPFPILQPFGQQLQV